MTKPLEQWDTLPRGFTFGQIYPASYGILAGHKHLGLDLLCPINTRLIAPCSGIVQQFYGHEGGKTVIFKPDNEDVVIRMMHLNQFEAVGHVVEGQLIGLTGNTGTASGGIYHLHLDISHNAVNINNFANFINPSDFFL